MPGVKHEIVTCLPSHVRGAETNVSSAIEIVKEATAAGRVANAARLDLDAFGVSGKLDVLCQHDQRISVLGDGDVWFVTAAPASAFVIVRQAIRDPLPDKLHDSGLVGDRLPAGDAGGPGGIVIVVGVVLLPLALPRAEYRDPVLIVVVISVPAAAQATADEIIVIVIVDGPSLPTLGQQVSHWRQRAGGRREQGRGSE